VASNSVLPYYTFPISVEDQGFCFVFSHYIIADSTLPNGDPDYFSSKTFRSASLSEIIRDALTSVGLAALSNVRKSEEIMVEARKKARIPSCISSYSNRCKNRETIYFAL
jgi:hypothetical protein